MTVTCTACGHELDRADATALAVPGGAVMAAWYCRDTESCRQRIWAKR